MHKNKLTADLTVEIKINRFVLSRKYLFRVCNSKLYPTATHITITVIICRLSFEDSVRFSDEK
jgi:hypothetical protein